MNVESCKFPTAVVLVDGPPCKRENTHSRLASEAVCTLGCMLCLRFLNCTMEQKAVGKALAKVSVKLTFTRLSWIQLHSFFKNSNSKNV